MTLTCPKYQGVGIDDGTTCPRDQGEGPDDGTYLPRDQCAGLHNGTYLLLESVSRSSQWHLLCPGIRVWVLMMTDTCPMNRVWVLTVAPTFSYDISWQWPVQVIGRRYYDGTHLPLGIIPDKCSGGVDGAHFVLPGRLLIPWVTADAALAVVHLVLVLEK